MIYAWYFIVILLSNQGNVLDTSIAFYQSRQQCENIRWAVANNFNQKDIKYRISPECEPVPDVGEII